MSLPQDLNDRHYGKYRETVGGIAVAVTNPDGTQISNALPTDGNNPSTELGYNAAGQLIRIRETIGATTYVRNITGDSITDAVVTTTKTFSSYSEE